MSNSTAVCQPTIRPFEHTFDAYHFSEQKKWCYYVSKKMYIIVLRLWYDHGSDRERSARWARLGPSATKVSGVVCLGLWVPKTRLIVLGACSFILEAIFDNCAIKIKSLDEQICWFWTGQPVLVETVEAQLRNLVCLCFNASSALLDTLIIFFFLTVWMIF